MKTTIEINDALLRRAKVYAAERNLTLKALVEQALRQYLDHGVAPPGTFKLRKHTFRGRGLQPGIDENDWATIRAMAYEGRGG
jgi:hypothetical protein